MKLIPDPARLRAARNAFAAEQARAEAAEDAAQAAIVRQQRALLNEVPGVTPAQQAYAAQVADVLRRERALAARGMQPALLPIRPVACPPAVALAKAASYTAEKRAELATWPGRESVIEDGCRALDGVALAIAALRDVADLISDTKADLTGEAEGLHDMASEIAGHYQRAAEEPAYCPHDQRRGAA